MNPKYLRMLKGLKPDEAGISWFVYILQCNDGTLYTGITNDVERRVQQHNDGKGARYTRTRRPVKLLYMETCEGRSHALIREYKIKSLPKNKKGLLVSRGGPFD